MKLGSLALAALSIPGPLHAFLKQGKMKDNNHIYDVVIIGGSYSGLSAAMALGRSLRTALIIDGGMPCNRQTPHSHNFITQDGETPAAIAAAARKQVAAYSTITFVDGYAVAAEKTSEGFNIATRQGQQYHGKKLILATGIKDTFPPVTGFAECWGISVVHCPYCHGYELRGKRTAIYANGDKAFHLASLVHNLTDGITILTAGEATFHIEQLEKLRRNSIQIVEQDIKSIAHTDGYMHNVVLNDGSSINFDAMYAALKFTQHSDIPASLGCDTTEHGHLKVDMFQKTTVEGIFACGDNSSMMRSLATSIYTGNIAGVMANMELTNENF